MGIIPPVSEHERQRLIDEKQLRDAKRFIRFLVVILFFLPAYWVLRGETWQDNLLNGLMIGFGWAFILSKIEVFLNYLITYK